MEKTLETISTPVAEGRAVSRAEWLEARRHLLKKEKELTRLGDKLRAERLALPWVRVEKDYVFQGENGPVSLADLFENRSQLIVQHFMFGPGWREGCVGCSLAADHVDSAFTHLQHHDVSYAAVSRAPIGEIAPFHKRMGWRFRWVSSNANDFNYDFAVSATPEDAARGRVNYNYGEFDYGSEEMSGYSVFYRDEAGHIYHTYSTYARGGEQVVNVFNFLDIAPLGRNEVGNLTSWVRHHDRYDAAGYVDATGRFRAADSSSSCCHNE